jgi:hypothetical protein
MPATPPPATRTRRGDVVMGRTLGRVGAPAIRSTRGPGCGKPRTRGSLLGRRTLFQARSDDVTRSGAGRAVWALRWGNARRPAFRFIPCGCEVRAERRFADLVVPSEVTVGSWYGMPEYAPFFTARVEDLRTGP